MTYTDENGRLYVNDTPVFARLSGGTLHCMIRAINKETFDAVALQIGLLRYENPAQDEIVDEEGNVIQEAVQASGDLIPAPDVTIARLGPYIITPTTYDENGDELTSAIQDDRYHVNFWLHPKAVENGAWESWIVQWMQSNDVGVANKNEKSLEAMGIELIDPLTIASPSNIIL